ncbi:hypothetical protein PanWU01x14_136450, partial [Parasponia andersonii]
MAKTSLDHSKSVHHILGSSSIFLNEIEDLRAMSKQYLDFWEPNERGVTHSSTQVRDVPVVPSTLNHSI